MTLKLDKSLECIINQQYSIDSSVLQEIEQRRQIAETSILKYKEIIDNAPKEIKEPEKTNSLIDNLINQERYEYQLKEQELKSIQDLLLVVDTQIDEIDIVIRNLDKCTNLLVNEINDQINVIKNLYDERIEEGCRNDLKWSLIGESNVRLGNSQEASTFQTYKIIRDIGKIQNNYYGIKYYQKPSNIDYGFKVIKEFNGTIQIGSTNLAVVSAGGTSEINIGDNITNDLDSDSTLFYVGEIPKVIGFGTTVALGIHTTVYGSISTGSTILAVTGIGTSSGQYLNNINLNDYVINSVAISTDTKVVGFGTTSISYVYNDGQTAFTTSISTPSVILNKVAIGSITNQPVGFGSYSNYPSLILSSPSLITLYGQNFDVVRQVSDITQEIDFTKNPVDPVKVGIINSNKLGIGHSIQLINNGNSSKVQLWREIIGDPEPSVGNNSAVYYDGNTSWPFINGVYAQENQTYVFSGSTDVETLVISISPTGKNINGAFCNAYSNNISTETDKLNDIKNKNLPKIQKLISISMGLREIRDKLELKAWAFQQSSAYNRSEMKDINERINNSEENAEAIREVQKYKEIEEAQCPNIENF